MINARTVRLRDEFTEASGRQLGEILIERLGSMPDACWLFCSPEAGLTALVRGVNDAIGGRPLIGCTTDGEISTEGFSTRSAVLGAIVSDQIEFEIASIGRISRDSEHAGRELAAAFSNKVKYVQMFSDGLTGDGSALLRGMAATFSKETPVAGGTAGDGGKFIKTWQFLNGRVLSDAAVAIGFSGDFRLGTGVSSGWSRIGLPKKVTKAAGNVLYELNGETALNVYERFLGKHAKNLPGVGVEYPLGLVATPNGDTDDDQLLFRATMSVDRDNGAIQFAGEIPEGAMVYLTCGDKTSILNAADTAVRQALDDLGPERSPAVAFLYSCMARKMLLGQRIAEELGRVQSQLSTDVPILGFYTYGEYCRLQCDCPSHLHNETVTLSVIGN